MRIRYADLISVTKRFSILLENICFLKKREENLIRYTIYF